MLDSTSRRPAFDRFFASLPADLRGMFIDDAHLQWDTLRDESPDVSFIDCLENVWDYWTEIGQTPDPAIAWPAELQVVGMFMRGELQV